MTDVDKQPCVAKPLVDSCLDTSKPGKAHYGSSQLTAKAESPPAFEEAGDSLVAGLVNGRAYFLDATRIYCVALVAIDHGAASYSHWNALYVQNWGLQFIFLTCGVSLGFSKRSLCGYITRLSLYFLLGVACNWTAWIVTGMDWMNDFWNVVFQMWFVVGLVLYTVMLWPLKQAFQFQSQRAKEVTHAGETSAQDKLIGVVLITLGFLGISYVSVVLHQMVDRLPLLEPDAVQGQSPTGFGYWFGGVQGSDNLLSIVHSLELSCRAMWVVLIGASWFPEWQSCLGWGVLFHMYLSRALFWYPAPGDRLCHGLDLMVLGLTTYYFGLYKRKRIGDFLGRYWFVLFLFCGLVWQPGTSGRFDSKPPADVDIRWRMQALEFVFVSLWLLTADRWFDHRIFTEDRLDFMSTWALLVFMVHKAIHIMLPSPVNWLFLLALIPFFWFMTVFVEPWCESMSSTSTTADASSC